MLGRAAAVGGSCALCFGAENGPHSSGASSEPPCHDDGGFSVFKVHRCIEPFAFVGAGVAGCVRRVSASHPEPDPGLGRAQPWGLLLPGASNVFLPPCPHTNNSNRNQNHLHVTRGLG